MGECSPEEAKLALADMALPTLVHKEDLVREARPSSNDDISPFVRIYRDGEAVVTAACRDVNVDEALEFAVLAMPAFDADAVTLAVDAHYTKSALNPTTGRPWGPHEMQNLCDKLGYCETGLITDAISIQRYERSGVNYSAMFPYVAVHSKFERPATKCTGQRPNRKKAAKRTLRRGHVIWSPRAEYMTASPGSLRQTEGRIAATIAQGFAETVDAEWSDVHLPELARLVGTSEPDARLQIDVLLIKLIAARGEGRWALMPGMDATVRLHAQLATQAS
jgi:hypothetical protein